MVILSDCLNIKFILVCNPKELPEVCCVCLCVHVCTFIVYLFSKLFGTIFWGCSDYHDTLSGENKFFCAANSEHLNFGLFGLWLSFVFEVCTLYL